MFLFLNFICIYIYIYINSHVCLCAFRSLNDIRIVKIWFVKKKSSSRQWINSTQQRASNTRQGHVLGWTFSVLLVDLMLWNVLAICEAENRWVSCSPRRCHGHWTTAFLPIAAEHIGALWSKWLKKEKIEMPSLCAQSSDCCLKRELFLRTCRVTEVIRGLC